MVFVGEGRECQEDQADDPRLPSVASWVPVEKGGRADVRVSCAGI